MSSKRPRLSDSSDEALISQFARDPEMRDLIEFFLEHVEQRAQRLETAFSEGQVNELGMLAHQLKGAAAGYGFPSLGTCAARLEALVTSGEASLSALGERVEELIRLCSRAAAGRSSLGR